MYLDRKQEGALQGERGEAMQWAMEVLVGRGDASGAGRLVPVTSVHIPDWYRHRSAGEWKWLAKTAGKVRLPVTANPGGPDDALSVARKAALSGLRPDSACSFTCTPYLAGNHPPKGRAAAWGGRAAVAFLNSVLGGRSEAEDFSSAMASTITGLTTERGILLEENRRPTIEVVVTGHGGRDLGLLGRYLSSVVRDQVPVIRGLRLDYDEARGFAFAINGEGRVPLFALREAGPSEGLERIEVSAPECRAQATGPVSPDLLIFGCPHLSEQAINRWGRRLAGRRPGRTEAWFFASQLCLDKCPHTGSLLKSRGRVLADMCPLGMTEEMADRTVGCDSPALASCLSAAGIDAGVLSDDELSFLLASD